jgi:hypothetical protein
VLPTFLVIGTNKAGTTTLYTVLRKHPLIFLPHKKELHFFNNDDRYARGADWYSNTFFSGAEGFGARGDITPAYLYWGAKVIPRVKAVFGSEPPRMVVILRDPVERAYSRYWHQRRFRGREPLSFEEAVADESRRLAADTGDLARRGKSPQAYFRGGLYAEQLTPWFESFPRELFHVMLFDDLKRDFDSTIRGLLGFLEVDATVEIAPVRSNPAAVSRAPGFTAWLRSRSGVGRAIRTILPDRLTSLARRSFRRTMLRSFSYPPMSPQTDLQLRRRYLPDIQKLERLIGRDLSRWYPPDHGPAPLGTGPN